MFLKLLSYEADVISTTLSINNLTVFANQEEKKEKEKLAHFLICSSKYWTVTERCKLKIQSEYIKAKQRGLGVDGIIGAFLKIYCDQNLLCIVLNGSNNDFEFYRDVLLNESVAYLPRSISSEYSVNERPSLYASGGVLFVSSRILVVDLLLKRFPLDKLNALFILNAHNLDVSCTEAFIVRLIKEGNAECVVKAFSDNPTRWLSGFNKIEQIMKSFFIDTLSLFPRFDAQVVNCLQTSHLDVVDMRLNIADLYGTCQSALLELINTCLRDLKAAATSLEVPGGAADAVVGSSWEHAFEQELDAVWHQLGSKARQLAADVRLLRRLLLQLAFVDSVTFFVAVRAIRQDKRMISQNTGWMLTNAFDRLFGAARQRVFGQATTKKRGRLEDVEQPGKWSALQLVMNELREELASAEVAAESTSVLIVCRRRATADHVRYLLDHQFDGRGLLSLIFDRLTADQPAPRAANDSAATSSSISEDQSTTSAAPGKKPVARTRVTKRRGSGRYATASTSYSKQRRLTDMLPQPSATDEHAENEQVRLPWARVSVHCTDACYDPYGLWRVLFSSRPRYVVLFDVSLKAIRQIEVFQCRFRPDASFDSSQLLQRVYLLTYDNGVDERQYRCAVQFEQNAFEYLITRRADLALPSSRVEPDDWRLARDLGSHAELRLSRAARVQCQSQNDLPRGRVVVDMREFGSELPSMLYRRGVDLQPVTLTVGDYVLCPDLCIERKSVPDLIGSLNNGRLYTQCTNMLRYYDKAAVLIEFDPQRAFSLAAWTTRSYGHRPLGAAADDAAAETAAPLNEVQTRLALLTAKLPRITLLWSPSPFASSQLFVMLKENRPEPDAAVAQAINASKAVEGVAEESSQGRGSRASSIGHIARDMLMKANGVSSKNVNQLLARGAGSVAEAAGAPVTTLLQLCGLPRERLETQLQNRAIAAQLFDFLHRPPPFPPDQLAKS